LLNKLLNIFRIPDLRNKVLFTVGLLCVYRIGFYVPLPGIDAPKLAEEMRGAGDSAFAMLSQYLSLFSGGDLTQGTIFGLGIMPYISASIIIQLLSTVVPTLEKLRKEGEPGMRKINEWTRYLAVAVALFQSTLYVWKFWSDRDHLYQAVLTGGESGYLFPFIILAIVSLTAGSCFLMWLGEQIETYGIGNGISLIITAGIIARMPLAIQGVYQSFDIQGGVGKIGLGQIIFLVACFIFIVGAAVLLTQAQRRIEVQQAKHMRGRRVYGGSRQYLPLRVNHAGVMPIIFASTLLQLPIMGLTKMREVNSGGRGWWSSTLNFLTDFLAFGKFPYEILFCLMIFFFAYFWNTVQFQPKEMANQLRDYGSFVKGIRPGKWTAQYLENVMTRITYVGAGFLCIIAIVPTVIQHLMLQELGQQKAFEVTQFLGGTGLLIVISVMLDLINRIEANLVMRNYGGFMDDSGGGSSARNKRPRGGPVRGPQQPQPAAFKTDDPRGLPA
jgi:preprotein translocase subunit SecY